MRLARNVLESVSGLEIYPIIGILIFLAFFVGVVIWVVRLNGKQVETYSKMPLDDDSVASKLEKNDSSKQQNNEI
jgi:cbb3-type cytochrome oxidase subunit 3